MVMTQKITSLGFEIHDGKHTLASIHAVCYVVFLLGPQGVECVREPLEGEEDLRA